MNILLETCHGKEALPQKKSFALITKNALQSQYIPLLLILKKIAKSKAKRQAIPQLYFHHSSGICCVLEFFQQSLVQYGKQNHTTTTFKKTKREIILNSSKISLFLGQLLLHAADSSKEVCFHSFLFRLLSQPPVVANNLLMLKTSTTMKYRKLRLCVCVCLTK